MYNFEFNEKEKENLLNNINFTNRQKEILLLLINNVPRKDLILYINCSARTIQYEIKKISEKIISFKTNKKIEYYNVYMHIFPNGKKYVGVCKNLSQRWGSCGLPYRNNIKMYKDIMKYGWNNIKHEILLTTSDSFKAKKLETKIIEIFDLTNDKKGYNKNL